MRDDIKAINLVWLSKTGLTNLNSGEGGSNYVDVKKHDYLGKAYPYVSGQAMRFYLKEAIRRQVQPEEVCIADEQGETCGQIESCVLCDLFGFMTTLPDVGALVRTSPVKVSPAMGLLPFEDNSVVDFLTRRHRGEEAGKIEGDIVNVELGVNIYRAGLSLDLMKVGAEEEIVQVKEIEGKKGKKAIRSVQLKSRISPEERDRRVQLLLGAVKSFSDYSKQARLLTDFTPDWLLASVQTRYSHRLQKALELEDGQTLNLQRLTEILDELSDDKNALFAGVVSGVISNHDEAVAALKARNILIGSPTAAIGKLIEYCMS